MLGIFWDCHCMQFQGKLMNQVWENDKNPTLAVDFGPFGPALGIKIYLWILHLIVVTHFYKLSIYAISRKTHEPNLGKFEKN